MDIKTKDDFYIMSWSEYQKIVDDLSGKINSYKEANKIEFDFVVPILRGGGVLAISLAHLLEIKKFYPVQYKYTFSNDDKQSYEPIQLLFSLNEIKDTEKAYSILVTEGNHCTGQTAQLSINSIKKWLPNAKIYYVSIARDYSFLKQLNNTVFEWYGKLSNETEKLTNEQCNELSIINKFSVFPWEDIEEEIYEVNSSMNYYN